MKDELINSIVCMMDSMGIDTEGIADRLYILMQNYEITPIETQLALRDDAMNEQLLKQFLAAKMVKGCSKQTIYQYNRQLRAILSKFGKPCTEITADDVRVYIALRLTQDGISKAAVQTCEVIRWQNVRSGAFSCTTTGCGSWKCLLTSSAEGSSRR